MMIREVAVKDWLILLFDRVLATCDNFLAR